MNISPRQSTALEIQDTLMCLGLNEVYGVLMERSKDLKGKSIWALTFARANNVDGVVRVYSPNFIMIRVNGRQNQIFKSAYDAKVWLVQEFA